MQHLSQLNNTINIGTSAGGAWSNEEHQRFLDALEKYGCGQSTSVFAAWHAITATVQTRSLSEVKAHANQYYLQLQMVNTQKRKEYLTMQHIDTRWTMHEDTALEQVLAQYSDGTSYPWEHIASKFRGRTARDVRERYHKLCYDIARIEAGQHVMMNLGRYPRKTTPRAAGDEYEASNESAIDCIITPTPEETQLLLRALEQVAVPANASPDVLAAVATAVAALASSKNKKPPKRTRAQFAAEEAKSTLERAIQMALIDPLAVLDLLSRELRLLPTSALRPKDAAPPTTTTTVATADVGFSVSPSGMHLSGFAPSYYLPLSSPVLAKEDTRSAHELIHLRTSPVHGLGALRSGAFASGSTVYPFAVFPESSPRTANDIQRTSTNHHHTNGLQDYGL